MPEHKYSDNEIINLVKKKDREVFKYIYRHITPSVRNIVMNSGGNPEDADEIEQKVIIHLYEKIISGNFKLYENTKLSTYLYSVGKKMWYKINNSHDFVDEYSEILVGIVENEIDISLTPETDYEIEVINALKKLDNECKEILVKFYYENKSMREISIESGTISEDNVRKRKYKCIQKLKKLLFENIK